MVLGLDASCGHRVLPMLPPTPPPSCYSEVLFAFYLGAWQSAHFSFPGCCFSAASSRWHADASTAPPPAPNACVSENTGQKGGGNIGEDCGEEHLEGNGLRIQCRTWVGTLPTFCKIAVWFTGPRPARVTSQHSSMTSSIEPGPAILAQRVW